MSVPQKIDKITDMVWEFPTSYRQGMRVPARIYATEKLLSEMDDGVFEQVTNVAMLPGIVKYALCMPDGHWGYGFPIGGIAAMNAESGVISPGGIGFDINCGMRLVRTSLTEEEVQPHLHRLVDNLFKKVPSGVGVTGFVKISQDEFRTVAEQGSRWCVENNYGWEQDLSVTEENGRINGADADKISSRAVERGYKQLGTLGSGNHYLEIQVAKPEHIFDPAVAKVCGIDRPNQVVVMFHCGSRGFGHQVATDYLQTFLKVMGKKYGLSVPDRELACAPFHSKEGQNYFSAMKCAMNISFANRQVITHRIREVFKERQRLMEEHGIYVKTASYAGLAEEAGPAYKNVDDVVGAAHQAGISKIVAKFVPIGNVKG